jgi:hypothetical protein
MTFGDWKAAARRKEPIDIVPKADDYEVRYYYCGNSQGMPSHNVNLMTTAKCDFHDQKTCQGLALVL